MHTWTFEMNIFEQHFYDKKNVATLITFAVQLKNVMHTLKFEMNIFEQHFMSKTNVAKVITFALQLKNVMHTWTYIMYNRKIHSICNVKQDVTKITNILY
jgi:hypothetical protein